MTRAGRGQQGLDTTGTGKHHLELEFYAKIYPYSLVREA